MREVQSLCLAMSIWPVFGVKDAYAYHSLRNLFEALAEETLSLIFHYRYITFRASPDLLGRLAETLVLTR